MNEDEIAAIEVLQTAVSDFHCAVQAMSSDQLENKAWGPKETLAHLVFWLESYVTQIKALLIGAEPEMVNGRFDDLNGQFVAQNRHVGVTEWLNRYQVACDELCDIVQNREGGQLVLTLKKGSSFQHPLHRFMIAEAKHIRAHLTMLHRQESRAYLSDVAALKQLGQQVFARFSAMLSVVADKDCLSSLLAELVARHEDYLSQIEKQVAQRDDRDWDVSVKRPLLAPETTAQDTNWTLLQRFITANERLCQFGQDLDPQTVLVTVKNHAVTLDYAISRIHADIDRWLKADC